MKADVHFEWTILSSFGITKKKNILCQSNCINNSHKHEKLSTVSCGYNTSVHERVTFRSAGVQIVHTSKHKRVWNTWQSYIVKPFSLFEYFKLRSRLHNPIHCLILWFSCTHSQVDMSRSACGPQSWRHSVGRARRVSSLANAPLMSHSLWKDERIWVMCTSRWELPIAFVLKWSQLLVFANASIAFIAQT